MGSTSFLGFSYPNLLLVFLNLLFLGTSLFILFFNLYWYSYIIYFVCDSASEFGAVGSTSFLGFSSSILILVNFFNFFKGGGGGGGSFLFIYFILSSVLVFLYNSIFCL